MKTNFKCVLSLLLMLNSSFAGELIEIDMLQNLMQKYHESGLGDDHPIIIELKKIIDGDIQLVESNIEKLILINDENQRDNNSKLTKNGDATEVTGLYVAPKLLTDGTTDGQRLEKIFSILAQQDLRKSIISIFPNKYGLIVAVENGSVDKFALEFHKAGGYIVQVGILENLHDMYGKQRENPAKCESLINPPPLENRSPVTNE